MKIAFVGSHCTGKTTAVWYVGTMLKQLGYESVEILPELARICPYPINEQASFATGLWIMFEQIKTEHQMTRGSSHGKKMIVLSDRSVIDNLAYATVSWAETIGFFWNIVMAWLKQEPYDLLLYFPIEWKPIDDGKRSTAVEWQEQVDRWLRWYLRLFGSRAKHVIVEGKDHKERCENAFHIVHSFLRSELKNEKPKIP